MSYADPYADDPYSQPYQLPPELGGNTAGLTNIQNANPTTLPPAPTIQESIALLHGAGASSTSGNAALWAQSGQNPQAFIQALIARDGLEGAQTDPTALNKIIAALKEVGVNASLDTRTDQYHKGLMLNGQFVKLLDGSDNWIWGAGDSGSGDTGGDAIKAIDPSYLSPFTKPFNLPTDAALPRFGGYQPFAFPDFQAPDPNEVENDKNYQFNVTQGRKGLEAAASAKGMLNSGGTLADVLGFGQQMASQYGNDVFNKKFNVWNANRTNAADAYRTNYGTQAVDPYQFDTSRANTTYDRALTGWQNERDTFYANQQNPFSKLYSLAGLGLNAASAG